MSDDKVLNIKIPKELHKAVRMKCIETDQSMKDLTIKALIKYIEDYKTDVNNHDVSKEVNVKRIRLEASNQNIKHDVNNHNVSKEELKELEEAED